MISSNDDNSREVLRQVPIPNLPADKAFYESRRKFRANAGKYAKARGHGREFRLITEIASRSTYKEPFAWTVIENQEWWAEEWGLSLRTLKRHLSVLRSKGLITVTVRRSEALRGARREEYEYPVYEIAPWLVEEVSRWSDSDFWPTPETTKNGPFTNLRKGQNGPFTVLSEDLDGPSQEPENPVNIRVLSADVTVVTSPTIYKNKEEQEIPTDRVSRRPRRRRKEPVRNQWDDDGYDPPVIGQDTERKEQARRQEQVRRKEPGTPLAKIAADFDKKWFDMLAQNPSLAFKGYPSHPWNHGTKRWFMGWLNKEFMRDIDWDTERASKIFQQFCRDLVSGKEFIAQGVPPFKRLQQRTDHYKILVPRTVNETERAEAEAEREKRASRVPTIDRRKARQAPVRRIESQYFSE